VSERFHIVKLANCPLCGKKAESTATAWGALIIGCPCVDPGKAIVLARMEAETEQVIQDMHEKLHVALDLDYANRDPGDEDRT
jgi:hypothetical protein